MKSTSYITDMKKKKIKPKTATVTLTSVPPPLVEQVDAIADAEGRSRSAQIIEIVKEHLRNVANPESN